MRVLLTILRLRFLAVALVLLTPTIAAADLAEDLQALTEKSNDTKAAAVENLAAGGHERVVVILQAYLDGRLFQVKADDRIVIGEKSEGGFRIADAMTGEALGEIGKRKVRKVRINNRLRQVVKGSLGALTLGSSDPVARMRAADAVFRSTQAEMIEPLEAAIAQEQDTQVAARFRRALAATRLATSEDNALRIAALKELADFTDPDVRARIAGLL